MLQIVCNVNLQKQNCKFGGFIEWVLQMLHPKVKRWKQGGGREICLKVIN
jgi:hypothetical protein